MNRKTPRRHREVYSVHPAILAGGAKYRVLGRTSDEEASRTGSSRPADGDRTEAGDAPGTDSN
jgi:hypothetical protein